MKRKAELASYVVFAALSPILLYYAWKGSVSMSLTEALGFVTGVVCVWLCVKEHIWNWPIGLANSGFYVVVFFRSRLYADMSLQVIYVILGILGWYWWLHGGRDRSRLEVSNVRWQTSAVLVALVALGTWGMELYLIRIKDSAPFLDALTTTMSLAAQYLITKKLIENWYVWFAVDVIYVYLYLTRHLYLTSVLYLLYLGMAVAGYIAWRQSKKSLVEKTEWTTINPQSSSPVIADSSPEA